MLIDVKIVLFSASFTPEGTNTFINTPITIAKKYRGKIDSVIMDYVKDMEKDLKNARPERVFITHSGCKQETVEKVRAYLEELDVFDEILETRAGGVISSHCGPGTLGVLYIAK